LLRFLLAEIYWVFGAFNAPGKEAERLAIRLGIVFRYFKE
jgi:hypothetical protein